MMGLYLKPQRLNVLSCAVAGRPGRSAYETAVAGGYEGTEAAYAAFLAGLPGALSQLSTYNGRVDAILELLGNQVADLELAVAALEARVDALEGSAQEAAAAPQAGGTDA